MKTIYRELNGIKKFIEQQLYERKILMAREPEDGEDVDGLLELVTPRVAIGNIPHANFSLYADDAHLFQAPYILIGFDEANYDVEDESIQILIQACAYTQVTYNFGVTDTDTEDYPDNMGMLDVTQLLEMIMSWIEEDADFAVSKPYRLGSYASRAFTYPYAFGYLEFPLETGVGTLHQRRFYGLE